jgi:hypothetical protein
MGVSAAISLLLALINNAGQISALIGKAQVAGRDLTPAELDTITAADDQARAALVAAIAAAKAAGK